MNRLFQAFRAFFRVLGDPEFAKRSAEWMKPAALPPAPVRPPTSRHGGLGLLSALQRDARLVDFLKEPIGAYSDAQVGAAVREVHRQAGEVLDRMFGLEPLLDRAEGETVVVPADYNPARIQLAGQVSGAPPYTGRLCHHGWRTTRCDVPEWTGRDEDAPVVVPAEVQID
jgi:hypothetical protein